MSENSYSDLRSLSPNITGGLIRMRNETFKDAVVPSKYKILTALSIVVATQCEPCIKGYTKMAYQDGETREELVDF